MKRCELQDSDRNKKPVAISAGESLEVIFQPLAWLLNRTDRSQDGSSKLRVSVE